MNKKIVDLSYLRNFCDNDEDFLQEMIQTFLEKIPEDLQHLTQAVKTSDWKVAYQAVHGLKSALYFVGLHELTPKLAKLESDLSREKHLEEAKVTIASMVPLAESALLELKDMLHSD